MFATSLSLGRSGLAFGQFKGLLSGGSKASPVQIVSITPSSATAGDADTPITVTGSGFTATSVINVNGSPKATTFVNATTLTATLTAGDLANPGFLIITVSDASYPTTSSPALFPVQHLVPTTSALAPSSVLGGGASQAVVITGTNFYANTVAQINGVDAATTFTDSTHVTVTIPGASLATAGTLSIRVRNPLPGGGPSNAQTFTVQAYALPVITTLTPSSAPINSSDTAVVLTMTGAYPATVARVDGTDVTTVYTDSTHVTATIPASRLTSAGTRAITARNPSPGGGTSASQSFSVVAGEAPYTLSRPLVYWLDPRRHADAGAGSAAWTYGTMPAPTPSGTTPPTLTLSGTATAGINLRVEITTGGLLAVAVCRVSADGGLTYAQTGVLCSEGTTINGITLVFAAGTYSTNNVYTSNVRLNAMTSRDKADGTIGDANKTAFESTVTVQHTLLLNNANYNNRPVIQCTSAGYMRTAAWAVAQGHPCTVALIGQAPAAAVRIASDGLANDMPSLWNNGASGVAIGSQTSFVCAPTQTWASTPRLVIGVFNGTSSAIYTAASGPQGTGDVGAAAAALTGMTIGANRLLASGWGTSGTGIIAGLWVWDGILTAGDISAFAAFCLSTWNRGW